MGSGRAPAQLFLLGLRSAGAGNATGRARPVTHRDPVCAALGSEKGRAAARLARAAAGRWCEIGLLPRESFAEHSGDRNALIVGRRAPPKTLEADPRRAARRRGEEGC
ncbi:hypothetical protein ERJ75_000136500 [Trypanosoma vivax]|nr:hypothetical protein ERJ75_000136500 [Trypanosoma vivax]